MIKMQVIGHLGRDAESKDVNGKTVINFSVAHTDKLKDGSTKTTWTDCAYWSDKVGVVPYLKKGTQVYVEGQPDIRTWESKDGKQGATLTLRVGQIQLLGGKSDTQQTQAAAPVAANDDASQDLPF